MIARTRVLQVKNIDVQGDRTEVRLTAPANGSGHGDLFAALLFKTNTELLHYLADQHGKRYRVTIEEMGQ